MSSSFRRPAGRLVFGRAALFTLLIALFPAVIPSVASDAGPDAAELRLAIQRLGVTGSALYLAAHPDDENTALLAWRHSGKLVRTAESLAARRWSSPSGNRSIFSPMPNPGR